MFFTNPRNSNPTAYLVHVSPLKDERHPRAVGGRRLLLIGEAPRGHVQRRPHAGVQLVHGLTQAPAPALRRETMLLVEQLANFAVPAFGGFRRGALVAHGLSAPDLWKKVRFRTNLKPGVK